MTTLSGAIGSSLGQTCLSDWQSGNVTDADDGVAVFDAWLAANESDNGSLTDNLPISETELTLQGDRGLAGSGNDHWYYRFHIIPNAIDVGNVISDFTTTFTVWNGWLTGKTLSAITDSGDTEGLTLVPFDTAPYVVPGIEEQTFSLQVYVGGPSLIDATYTFVFETGQVIGLPITGQRIFAWTFRPDWSRAIEERLEWATDVMTAYDGTEQRFGLRANPRRTLAYQFAIENNSDRMKFESMLFNWGARTWLVPFWMEGNVLHDGLASGQTSITLGRVSSNWQAECYAIIMSAAFTYEIVRVESIAGNTVTLSSPTVMTWQPGALVFPAVTGLLEDKQNLSRFTGATEYGLCTFRLFETETAEADSPTTYRGLPVITQAPYWQRDITHDFVRKLREIDFRVGKFAQEDESGMPFNIISHHWCADGKDEIDALRSFIYARAGKHKAVWLPTFAPDMQIVDDSLSGSVYIDVEHCFLTRHILGHINRRDIRIELYDGTVMYRRVTDIEELSATVERLTIDSAVSADATPETVDRISWMSVARFDTDSISMSWKHDDWVEMSVNWRTARDDV